MERNGCRKESQKKNGGGKVPQRGYEGFKTGWQVEDGRLGLIERLEWI